MAKKSQVTANEALEAIGAAVADMAGDATTTEPEAPKGKAKRQPKEKPEPVAKPEPVTIDGFVLAADADVASVQEQTDKAIAAVEAITRKDADLLSSYLELGRFQSSVVSLFASAKVYGQYVAAKVPASQNLDPALRSNCKWLFEAINQPDHDAADLLTTLGVNRIEDFKSANPTVIRREYKAKKDAKKLATEMGVAEGDEEALAKAKEAKKLADKEANAKEAAKVMEAINFYLTNLQAKPNKARLMEDLKPLFTDAVMGKAEGVAGKLVSDYEKHLEEMGANDEDEE